MQCILLNANFKIVKTLTTLTQDIKVAETHQALYQILIDTNSNLKAGKLQLSTFD